MKQCASAMKQSVRGSTKSAVVARRPAATDSSSRTRMGKSFGKINVILGSQKSYIVRWNLETMKWALVVVHTRKYSANHADGDDEAL